MDAEGGKVSDLFLATSSQQIMQARIPASLDHDDLRDVNFAAFDEIEREMLSKLSIFEIFQLL